MVHRLALLIFGFLACPLWLVTAQDIDANLAPQKRTPSTIADQITDSAERACFPESFQAFRRRADVTESEILP